jgi:flagellar biosynthesis chaperone FliJ
MDFSELNTSAEWSSSLQDLINLCKKAVETQNFADIGKMRTVLENYINELSNNAHLAQFDELERISTGALLELNRASRTIALRNLGNLTGELTTLDSQLRELADDANDTSDKLQLKSTKNFLSKAKSSLNILKGLRTELDDDTTDLGKKVAALFKAIKEFDETFLDA